MSSDAGNPLTLESLGVRTVLKADVGNREFFAGLTPDATIATHNIRVKDFEP